MLDFSLITACGECCSGCKKKQEGICPGCIEADGYVPEWSQSGRCRIHACVRNQNVQFCGLCSKFPCADISQMMPWNPNVVEYLKTLRDEYIKQNEL